jgi:hypothetical protein
MTKDMLSDRLQVEEVYKMLLVPQGSIPRQSPILFLQITPGQYQEYQLVLFDYKKGEVFVFGYRAPTATDLYASWKSWNGFAYWKAIAKAFGWKLDKEPDGRFPKVIMPNWTKVCDYRFLR